MIRSPQVPSSDLTVSLPVADKTVTLADLANDTTEATSAYLDIGPQQVLTLDFGVAPRRRQPIGDRLRFGPAAGSFATPIGAVDLPGRPLPEATVPMAALLGHDPGTGWVRRLAATVVDYRHGLPLADLEAASVASGGLDLTLANHLPVPIHDLRLSLVDAAHAGAAVAVLDLGDVEPGAQAAGLLNLGGRQFAGALSVRVRGRTPEADSVYVAPDGGVSRTGALLPLVATSATAPMPAQQFAARQTLYFSGGRVRPSLAAVEAGGLAVTVRNGLPTALDFLLWVDEWQRADGSADTLTLAGLGPGQTRQARLELGGGQLRPADPLRLGVSYLARVASSALPVTVRATDAVGVDLATDVLVCRRVEGVLDDLELPFGAASQALEVPRGLGSVALETAQARVFLQSAVGLPGRVALALRGTNRAGQAATLALAGALAPGDPRAPVAMVVEPPSTGLAAFLSLLPTQVEVEPTAFVGDGATRGVVETTDWVQIDSVQFVAPGRLTVTADTQVRPKPDLRELKDADARQRLAAGLVNAQVQTTIDNHLPIGVGVSLCVTSWPRIVRDVIRSVRPELGADEALLVWLVERRAWELLSAKDRVEVRDRLEEALKLPGGTLRGKSDEVIVARIRTEGNAADRALFIDLVLGSLDNDVKPYGESEVEQLLGVAIGRDEWIERLVSSVYDQPELRIPSQGGPFRAPAAAVDGQGRITEGQRTRSQVALTAAEASLFVGKGGVYTGVLTDLDATPAQVVLLSEHYVTVQAAAKIHLELGEALTSD